MSFEVDADAYGQFMGRFSEPLAQQLVVLAGVTPGQQALDVGCGTGVLTALLVQRLGPTAVAAIDPSESFVAATRSRFPETEVRQGAAENLPYLDGTFDVTLAQLVVHFMTDPESGMREMARVTRDGGTVAASVWDHAGGRSPLSPFWRAVLELDPQARDESALPGVRSGHLADIFSDAGLREIEATSLTVRVKVRDFDEWWTPFTLGVGPAGEYVARLDPARREEVRARCAELLPADGPFEITGTAWTVLAHA
jgi:SAM-dependent methyltransferase